MHLIREPDFSQTCRFNRITKVIMVHDLNPTNLHINELFYAKSQKPYFGGVLGHFSQNEIFPKKSDSVRFLPLRHPNFIRSFRKTLWAVLEKTCLPNDILTYWQWWNHRTAFRLNRGSKKYNIANNGIISPSLADFMEQRKMFENEGR